MGREIYARYPLYDLGFRIMDDGKEVTPDSLETFRLGLVENRLPAIWGGWRYGALLYKVSVMTVPDEKSGNFDLYKLEVQNPTDQPQASGLAAILEGPPDMWLEDGVVRGLGSAPFLIADPAGRGFLRLREWGLCDKRAKAHTAGPGPDATEPAVSNCRIGLDGVPVVYRLKAEPGKRYVICLVSRHCAFLNQANGGAGQAGCFHETPAAQGGRNQVCSFPSARRFVPELMHQLTDTVLVACAQREHQFHRFGHLG
ncbi:MAG TPA: hypothetical protein VN829_12790 [Dongiaceae bacterium]|nr:hypothetical protein [Dongiaceae bacterium]